MQMRLRPIKLRLLMKATCAETLLLIIVIMIILASVLSISFSVKKKNIRWGNEADSHTAKSLSCCFELGSVRGKNMYFLISVRDCVQQLHSTTSSTNWPILMSAKCHFIIKAWPSPSNWLTWLFLHSMALYTQYIRHTVNYIHNIHRWWWGFQIYSVIVTKFLCHVEFFFWMDIIDKTYPKQRR